MNMEERLSNDGLIKKGKSFVTAALGYENIGLLGSLFYYFFNQYI